MDSVGGEMELNGAKEGFCQLIDNFENDGGHNEENKLKFPPALRKGA